MIDGALAASAAFAAGLAGSAHCASMCGGIAAAVGATLRPDRRAPVLAGLAFNAARIASYALVGGLLAAGVGLAGARLPVMTFALVARLVAALLLAALAIRLATRRDFLGIERAGAVVWRAVRPLTGRAARLPPALRPVALGGLWGLMPCGLVYSVMLVAAAEGTVRQAMLTMLAYGAGTLPAMLGITLAAGPVGNLLQRRGARQVAAAMIMGAAAWTAAGAFMHADHLHHATDPDCVTPGRISG